MAISPRMAAGAAVLFLLAAILPLTAVAATFTIEIDRRVVRGDEGTRVTLGVFDTPDEFVGQVCSLTATGNNNTSVHPDNDVEIASENVVTLEGVEDFENKTTVADGELVLGETITFTLILGPDGVYSAELDVTFDCQPPSTSTTTTEPSSTTTTAPTTTTTEPVTTTTEGPTTTTEPPTTTTTEPTTSTTSEPEATTTTAEPEVSPTTVGPTSTTGDTDETLPFTGADTDDVTRVAYVALILGTGLVLLARHSTEEG